MPNSLFARALPDRAVPVVLLLAPMPVLWSFPAEAQANEEEAASEIIVFGRATEMIGIAATASEGVVGYSDLEDRPISRPGEVLEVIPGLVATQHSGSGKANQYFLRGFNLDHGTDFAAFVDGTPVNFRTHGHGQGYLDLNFIIPEITAEVQFQKGPYFSDVGDFAVAGSSRLETYDVLPHNIAQVTVGENGYRRGLVAASINSAGNDTLLALETVRYDNAFVLDEDAEKFNLFLKHANRVGPADWSLSLSAYDASWNSTDQVPQRAVTSGLIPRLGFIDPDLGGETTRVALAGDLETSSWSANAYAIYYDFSLFSNFTYFANDPVNGDEFEQQDERFTLGGTLQYRDAITWGDIDAELLFGTDLRHDEIFNIGLFQTDARARLATVRDDVVSETSIGAYAQAELQMTDRLRANVGLRYDVYFYDIDASIDANSGSGSDAIFTPSLALAWQAADQFELYASYGHGFHSNDARGAAISLDPATLEPTDPVDLLVRAKGGEIGARFESGNFNASVSAFYLELDSELVFVGDAGTTEPNNGSERYGIEANAFWRPADWISFDASAAYTRARFNGTAPREARIPQSVGTVIGAGVNVRPTDDLVGSLRLRHFGSAPLIEDGSVFSDATTVINLGLYQEFGPLRAGIDILNLLDADEPDISYFFASQLAGEAGPVDDIHEHPIEPRQVRVTLGVKF